MTETKSDAFDLWAIVELFGHQKMAGHVTTVTIGSASFLRLDVPDAGKDAPGYTRFLNPSAIYAINPTSEEIARAAALSMRPVPVHHWELPRQLADHVKNGDIVPIDPLTGMEDEQA